MKHALPIAGLGMMLAVGPATSALAQGVQTPAPAGTATPANTAPVVTDHSDYSGWGWIGLIGLVGLAGLIRVAG